MCRIYKNVISNNNNNKYRPFCMHHARIDLSPARSQTSSIRTCMEDVCMYGTLEDMRGLIDLNERSDGVER